MWQVMGFASALPILRPADFRYRSDSDLRWHLLSHHARRQTHNKFRIVDGVRFEGADGGATAALNFGCSKPSIDIAADKSTGRNYRSSSHCCHSHRHRTRRPQRLFPLPQLHPNLDGSSRHHRDNRRLGGRGGLLSDGQDDPL